MLATCKGVPGSAKKGCAPRSERRERLREREGERKRESEREKEKDDGRFKRNDGCLGTF